MISLCCPTRGRPERFEQMVRGAQATASGQVEVVAVIDPGDAGAYSELDGVVYVETRCEVPLSDLWNVAAEHARGDVLQMAADDLSYETPGWDEWVSEAFTNDGITLVWCDDGTPHARIATHPFITRRWLETIGRFTPPYYEAWNADTWLLDVAVKIKRIAYLSSVVIRHEHVDYGTAPDDATYQLRRPLRPAAALWHRPAWVEREEERVVEARRLRAAMIGGPLSLDEAYYREQGLHPL